MNNRIAVITGLIASLALSACNKAETPAPDTTQTPSAQTENNHSNEAKPENQAPAEQQAKDSEQAQPDAQAPAAAGNDRLFQAESAEQFKALIAEGVDVNTRDNNGRTVLFDVDLDFAKGGDYSKAIEIAKILIDAGIDVNAKDKDGKSVLFEITYVKEIEPYLKLLLDHGADAKVKAKDGSTVLFVATNKEDYGDKCVPQLVKMLIDAGADVDAKNNKGQTFLEAADENCKNLIVSTLKLPAKISLSESEIKSILSIMGVKAQNVNKQDEDGCTPLFFVNNAREASALIASGADVNHVADDGETALFWAVRDNKDPMIAKVLVDAGANVNHHSKDGYTALFYAESEDFVKMLVSCGANIFHVREFDDGGGHDEEYAIEHLRSTLEIRTREGKSTKKLQQAIDALDAVMHPQKNNPAPADPAPESSEAPSPETQVDNNALANDTNAAAPEAQNDTNAGDANQAATEAQNDTNTGDANQAAPEVETTIPPSDGGITCANWDNALFVDGTELYYKIKVEQSGGEYENDENYEPEFEFYVSCTVKLNYASDIYCGSFVACDLDPKYKKEKYERIVDRGLPVEGQWFIDKNGYYRFQDNQFTDLVKTSNTGNCKTGHSVDHRHVDYVNCEPGTLAWEYKPFKTSEPLIPLSPDVKVYESGTDEHGTFKRTVARTGTVLCHHSAYEGDDTAVNDICIDDTKGPTSFKRIANGAFDFMMKGTLRQKTKK